MVAVADKEGAEPIYLFDPAVVHQAITLPLIQIGHLLVLPVPVRHPLGGLFHFFFAPGGVNAQKCFGDTLLKHEPVELFMLIGQEF